jgi:hypothetical protein
MSYSGRRVIGSQWKGQTVCASTIVQCPYVPYPVKEKKEKKVSEPLVFVDEYSTVSPELHEAIRELAEQKNKDNE